MSANKKTVIIVMGVSACGKSTIAKGLQNEQKDVFYIEGDDLHPQSNIDKMSQGTPLNDDDRYPWLCAIHNRISSTLEDENCRVVIASCSSLKHKYREILTKGESEKAKVRPIFLHLKGDFDVLLKRISQRKGHFMKSQMLESQYAALEWPYKNDIVGDSDTDYDTLTVELTESKSASDVIAEARRRLNQDRGVSI
ncbi:gluconokinase [Acrasis kona]|uniref:Gluconokinase n=1 Tax=Acrasis kona TaxID=1008807 RepID=A0AAW2ZP14_9EUKA